MNKHKEILPRIKNDIRQCSFRLVYEINEIVIKTGRLERKGKT